MALFVVGDLGGTNCRLELLDTSIPEARWHGTRPTVAKAKYGSATALPAPYMRGYEEYDLFTLRGRGTYITYLFVGVISYNLPGTHPRRRPV